ncbi:MAG: hypothetical protein Q4P07_14115 [Ornithinimicrobium sp.]|uniref:hypothetical protein n=1 Tax=Ornithinimicrobium sp. TaxID=1977084 RepID=UPI0026DF9331|nr:hypothetical protein [Ornithinimicrobium sp.]MDO5741272.1 hypothetical protein [Ornithinimicrobium sp.]
MEIVEQELAMVEKADAYRSEGLLIVRLAGTRPSACHVVSIEPTLTDVEPPAFAARMSVHPLMRCAMQEVDFEAARAFRIEGARPEVVVHHAGGELTVDVKELPVADALRASVTTPLQGDFFGEDPVEATGYSRAYDLSEAVREAVDKLPVRGADIPDWLRSYTIVSMGIERGGIGGFDHLKVTVRG